MDTFVFSTIASILVSSSHEMFVKRNIAGFEGGYRRTSLGPYNFSCPHRQSHIYEAYPIQEGQKRLARKLQPLPRTPATTEVYRFLAQVISG